MSLSLLGVPGCFQGQSTPPCSPLLLPGNAFELTQVALLLGLDTPEHVSGKTLACGIKCSFKSRLKLYFVFPHKE